MIMLCCMVVLTQMPIMFQCICHGHEPCYDGKQSTRLTVDEVVVRAEGVGNIEARKGVVS